MLKRQETVAGGLGSALLPQPATAAGSLDSPDLTRGPAKPGADTKAECNINATAANSHLILTAFPNLLSACSSR